MTEKQIRRRLDPAERREMILEEALQLFDENPFSAISMRQIASACGVNMALLYHYFANKDELVRATLRHAIDAFVHDFTLQTPAPDAPLGAADAWLDATILGAPRVRRMVKLIADLSAGGNRDVEAQQMVDDFYRGERATLEEAIRAGIDEGRFRPVDAIRTARLTSIALDGIFYGGPPRNDFAFEKNIHDLRDQLLDYLRPSGPDADT
ncbi:MAG: TetR/AcrR family transcriptional regulator [Parvibaculum sp.]